MSKKKKSNSNQTFAISVFVGIVVLVGALFFVSKLQDKKSEAVYPTITGVKDVKVNGFDTKDQPTLSNKEAKIEVVEFGDYKCPICADWNRVVFPQLKADYIDKGLINFSFINYPFISKDSNLAALASEVVYKHDKESFWKFQEEIYLKQEDETKTWATQDKLASIAKSVIPNLDVKQFKKDLYKKETMKQVANDVAIANHYGVQGTPTIFVNGKAVDNPSLESIKAAIDAELNK
ncbi:DsbA family protein [Gottfriedia luciferensis]|uniref:DsbA family protein n=1 Tax=Gottfriedia luciferensis TaxID=178774 RepID=UPI00130216CB|nr:thioredoxin domain-containing protein [Gottfriedia luciferensis]